MKEYALSVLTDAGYGVRLMRRSRLTTAAAILTIALGVGANTAMFTVVNAVLLQLPFDDPDRLVSVLRHTARGYSAGIPLDQLRVWTGHTTAMESLAGYSMSSPVLTGAGEPDRLRLECVSASIFPMLGVMPAVGRAFSDPEDRPGAEPVVVVSHRFWAERFGRDRRAIGRSLVLDGIPFTVIGVMPETFDGPRALRRLDGWIPLAHCRDDRRLVAGNAIVNVFARLRPDATSQQAEAQLDAATLEPTAPGQDRLRVHLAPMTDQIYGDVKEPLLALSGAAGFVLLLACANVASLLLARVQARRTEVALRAALGCSRARLVRQLLTESVFLALCGGAAGLLIAHWSLNALVGLMPGYIRRIDHIAIDGYVLTASVALSAATGLLFGLFPALHASRLNPGAALKEASPIGTPARQGLRHALIVAEIALSVALVAGAGLMVQTFLYLRPVSPGFDPEHKVVATIALPRERYQTAQAWAAFVDDLRERLVRQPGIHAVVAASYVPLSGFISTGDVQHPGGEASPAVTVYAPRVSVGYFQAMNIPILRGRAFTSLDGPGVNVAIASEAMAQRMWPGQNPIGRQLVFRGLTGTSTKTIVGIARDVRDSGNRLTAAPALYVPFGDEAVPTVRIIVTTFLSAAQTGPVIRREVAALDPLLPLGSEVESLVEIMGRSVATWRFAASLLTAFATIAVILAAVGLFAVVGSWVTERTPEIGVRMALGAARAQVLRLFVGRSAVLTALGAGCGLVLAALTTRYLSGWLVNTSPLDRSTFAAAAIAMAAVCLLATWLAARRAMSVDPLTALRS